MVLVERRHAATPQDRLHPDATRIAGITGAIILNTVVFAALMTPAKIPFAVPTSDLIMVEIQPQVKKPPLPPPEEVKVVRQQTQPVREPRPAAARVDPPPAQHITESSDTTLVATATTQASTDTVSQTSEVTSIPAGPVSGVQLEYAHAPAPAYPPVLVRNQVQGTVLLRILVDVDGKPLEVSVARSSGSRELDRAAVEQVRKRWMFRPAMRDGRAVQAIGMVPIDFKLQ